MKKSAPVLLLVLLFSTLNSQYSFQKLLSIPYGKNQDKIGMRKEYDGSYGPGDFFFSKGLFYILDSENGELKVFNENASFVKEITVPANSISFKVEENTAALLLDNGKLNLINFENSGTKIILESAEIKGNAFKVFDFHDGNVVINNYSGNEYSCSIDDAKESYNFPKVTNKYNIFRSGENRFIFNSGDRDYKIETLLKTASVRFLGFDKFKNLYFDVESFISEAPCGIKREIFVMSESGSLKTKIILPNIYYAFIQHDLYVDNDGCIYHLLANKSSIELIKLIPDEEGNSSELHYPSAYDCSYHYNSHIEEPVNDLKKNSPGSLNKIMVTRDESLQIADTYYKFEWVCLPNNISNGLILAYDGKYISTPGWIGVGNNKQMPYKWGGFSTLTDYTSGVSNGKYAGDDNCTGNGSNAAVGVDCSGFVSRCWKLSSHYATSMMPDIMLPLTSWDNLKSGDVIHRVGHVRLCVGHNSDGTVKVIEASGVDWRVSYRNYSYNNLSGYSPYKYKNMTEPTTNINNNILPSAQLVVKNYPNPFNGKINFLISSPGVAKAKIIIFDCLGRVIELKDIQLMTGENTFSWNSLDMEGKTVSSGVYFFRISTETEKNFLFNKIVLLR